MNPIDGPGGERVNNFSDEQLSNFDESLINEMKDKIFSYLNETDFQSTNLVNREWNARTVNVVATEEFQKIKGFVNLLKLNLADNFVIQRDSLGDVVTSNPLLDSVNLINVKVSINTLREKIINVLKDVDDSELKRLDDLLKDEKPKTLEHLFVFVKLYKQIESFDSLSSLRNEEQLRPIVEKLVELGNLKKALELIKIMPKTFEQQSFILNIANKLLEKGVLSLELIKTLGINVYVTWQKEARQISKLAEQLSQFSIKCANKGDFDKALEITTVIPVLAWMQTVDAIWGNFESGPRCHLDIDFPEHSEKVKALQVIAQKLADKGEFGKARDVADRIDEHAPKTKKEVFEYIKTKENP